MVRLLDSLRLHLVATTSIVVIASNLALWILPLMLLAILRIGLPGRFRFPSDGMDAIYRAAVRIDDAWLRNVVGARWTRPARTPRGALRLERGRRYLVIANHSSWADILLLQSVIVRDGPILVFAAKRELVWLPIVGVVLWAFDFPLLRRRAGAGRDEATRRREDLRALRDACAVLRERPAALVNFVEGTRRRGPASSRARGSAYVQLLEPRTGGFSAMLDALEGDLDAVVDVTFVYPQTTRFWRFLAGAAGEIEIEAERIPPASIPSDRIDRAAWLEARWRAKDERLRAGVSVKLPSGRGPGLHGSRSSLAADRLPPL